MPLLSGRSGSLSTTHFRAISWPPFTGGLFIGQDAIELLSSGPFVIDHDKALSLQTNLHFHFHRTWWTNA